MRGDDNSDLMLTEALEFDMQALAVTENDMQQCLSIHCTTGQLEQDLLFMTFLGGLTLVGRKTAKDSGAFTGFKIDASSDS